MQVDAIQQALKEAGLDGWLLYDFKHSNPIAQSLAGFPPDAHHTRRWFCLIPAAGEPQWLHHAIEAHHFADRAGTRTAYSGWRDLEEHLGRLLAGRRRIAMEYSPRNAVPYVSRVDAGTLEVVRGFGVEVVSSGDLVSRFEASWDAEGLAGHRRAAQVLADGARRTHAYLVECARRGEAPTEYEVQQKLAGMLRDGGLHLDDDPIVAVGANAANPHYSPGPAGSLPVKEGEVVLLDLWGREDRPGSIHADITWMAFLGRRVPDEVQTVWDAVAGARDAAVAFLRERAAAGVPTRGFEADDVARGVLAARGLDRYFIHRLGHSIGVEVHGNGANLDHLETVDERLLLPHTGFSVEPGVYLPGRFGVRSEIDVYWGPRGAEVTTPMQEAMPALLA